MVEYLLREATVADAATIARHRRLMFQAMGVFGPEDEPGFNAAVERYVERELPGGRFRAWIVEADGQPVAGGALLVHRGAVPFPGFLDDEPFATLFNVWTEPAHRRRGLAERIVRTMIDWCRERGIRRLSLHATEEGRGLYVRLGFEPTSEMRLTLD